MRGMNGWQLAQNIDPVIINGPRKRIKGKKYVLAVLEEFTNGK